MSRNQQSELDILSVPWRIAGISSIVFAVSLVIWASVTKIPIRVTGQGIYYSIGDTSSFITSDYGKVHLLYNQTSKDETIILRLNNSLRDINRALKPNANTEFVITTAEELMNQLSEIKSKQTEFSVSTSDKMEKFPLEIPPYHLIAYAESSQKKSSLIEAIGNKNAITSQLQEQTLKNNFLKETLGNQLKKRTIFQNDLDKLASAKLISKLASLENRETIDTLKSQIASLDTSLQEIKTNLARAKSQVKPKFDDFVANTLLFSNRPLYIQQVSIPRSDHMAPGRLIISYSKQKSDKPDEIPVFFNAKDVATLQKYNNGLVSLPGFPRSIYGGIKAKVVNKENLSVVSKQAETFLGLSGFSEFLEYNFISPTMVKVRLEDDDQGNYLWTIASPTGNPPKIKIGDKVDMEVITGTITPIQMIIPMISNTLGLTPPEPKVAKPKADQKQ